jgi:hypothetical protein
MKFSFSIVIAFIVSFNATSILAQKQPVIISPKSVETTISTAKEPNFIGNQISFDNEKNQVIFKENAGFKTDKLEIQNAETVIFDKKEMTFKVINAEKIFTNLKIIKLKTIMKVL